MLQLLDDGTLRQRLWERKGMEKGGDRGARDTPKKKARQRKAQGRKVQANLEDPREDLRENRKV